MRTHVHFTRISKIETMYKVSRVNVQVVQGFTLTFTRSLSYMHITSILLARVKFTCVRTCKLRDSGNPPLLFCLALHIDA